MSTAWTGPGDSAAPGRGGVAPAAPARLRCGPAERGRGYWATLAAIGAVGGVLSGLFAIGGGILMVPLLIWRAHLGQRQAAATSLVAVIPAAAVSSATYLAHGDVSIAGAALVAPGAVAGAVAGSHLLRRLPLAWLRWMFIAFIVANAVRLLAVAPERGHPVHLTAGVALGYAGLGLVVGTASGLFGIGGGIIAVPLLISGFAVSDLTAKGTALLVSIPASVAGTVTSRRSGLVDVRAGLIVGTAAAAASVPAVYAALVIPAALSEILFAALLLAVAVQLVIKALPAQRIQAAGHRAVAQSQVSTSGDLALTPPQHQETSAPGTGADRPGTARFPAIRKKEKTMGTITTTDGTEIFYKDWGAGRPVVFSHGWPLTADAWDDQLFLLASSGYRAIAHDRRGGGRSGQPWDGNNLDTYADDLAAVIDALDLHDAVLVGHSTGGGEVARYIGRHGTSRVAKAVLVSAIPPLMLKTSANPEGQPLEVFDGLRASLAADRSQFYQDLSGPFYGANRNGSTVSQGLRDSFWLLSMTVGEKGAYDCIRAFSETDTTEDLKKFDVPTLIIHGDDDQIVPIAAAALKSAKISPDATLKVYPGAPHGLAQTTAYKDTFNNDLLDFIKS